MDIIQLIRIFTIFTNSGIFLVSGGVQSTGGSSYNALPGVDGGTQSPHQAIGPGSHPLGAISVAGAPPPPPLGPGAGATEPAAGPLGRFAPYFDAMTPRNVTALVGKSAYLSCRVRNLGNKTVSWIRHRDIHILTVGSYTYTSDQRFQANHHAETDEWTLQIKWAQKRDAGIYECQISTQPVRSYFVNLNVVVPTAAILGGPDIHVDKGSTINLTCSIRFSPEPPAYIFWYHHDDVISFDSNRGGVTIITDKGDVTTSVMLIQHAEISDSGKYSCSPSNADVASVRVYVLNGERPAAMQTGSAGLSNSSISILTLMALLYLYTVVYTNLQLSGVALTSPSANAAR